MRGITEERLIEVRSHYASELNISDTCLIDDLLNDECTELNPWQPIDENTPEHKRFLVIFPDGQFEVARLVDGTWLSNDNLDYDYGCDVPTHFCELPADPVPCDIHRPHSDDLTDRSNETIKIERLLPEDPK